MRIEELVIEGFKSYPVRTQITGWDPSFNAITGLNGSGKSNILDAICFVLGITNMSQMRAANQQDLIYKRGQAGVTKASVTIVFDNSDRSKSPVGFEDYKQITVTRQIALPNVSKYLLNGHKAPQQNIQTLFQSVQLNINNPNFVIMQGRITKVLNMRPQEILGMVEEAAGTRMFEERKEKALKTMSKKEKRVDEITSLLATEITPKLEKLRAEKRSFIQFQKTCSELEKIWAILHAWEWVDGQARVDRKKQEAEEKEQDKKMVEKQRKKFLKEAEAAEKEVADVQKRKEAEVKKGGRCAKLQARVDELGKELVKMRTQREIKEGIVKDEDGKVADIERELQQLDVELENRKTEVQTLHKKHAGVKETQDALSTKLTAAEELLQTLLTGLSSNNDKSNSGGGYMGQLAAAKQQQAQAHAAEEQSRVKLGMAQESLRELEKRWGAVEREAGESRERVDKMRREVKQWNTKLGKCGWSEQQEKESEERVRNTRNMIKSSREKRDHLRAELSRLAFEYNNPTPNFDRSKVLGVAAKLITLDKAHDDKAAALEVAAGGKLFHVVVADESIGKDLIKNGGLRKRVTMVPLNRINAFKLTPQKIQAAQRLAPNKAFPALSLVTHDPAHGPAIAYVFGDTLICTDAQSAKLVTFDRSVGVRSVTLEGDVYDPSGTLSGGANPVGGGGGLLIKVRELKEVEGKLEDHDRELAEWEDLSSRKEWAQIKREVEIREHELGLLEVQVGGSNAERLAKQIDEAKQAIVDLKVAVQAAQNRQKEARDECKKLEQDMVEFKDNKEGKIEELKASISKQKSALQKHTVVVKTQHKELQTATIEMEQLEGDIDAEKQKLKDAKDTAAKIRKDLATLDKTLAHNEGDYSIAEVELNEELAKLGRFDTELKALEVVIKEKKEEADQAELEVSKLGHDIQVLGKERTAAINFVANLEKQYDWMAEDKHLFGKPGTKYDFEDVDIEQMREKAKELEGAKGGMKKKINPKVMNMIDNVEKREATLTKMLATVLKDKEKIEETIEELDRYKRDALQKTWEKVDGDFGGIFAELLPGNFAKLQPPEGQDLMQGLEVKVRLGTVWKQSLTELSGGQRSLIALSLIMALLQFKPAPMYILDEIDAALDLSHTQHIGQLFRTRFKGSQFIVVSLKEGLFTNANVLFRARFRDGTSIVERTAQRSTSNLYAEERGDDEDNARNPTRRRMVAA